MGRILLAVVFLWLLLSACGMAARGRPAPPPPASAAATSDRPPITDGAYVVAVTVVCRYVTWEGANQVTRTGEGPFCQPTAAHLVGAVAILQVFDVRVVLTIRSPFHSDYEVESHTTETTVGDRWPSPSR